MMEYRDLRPASFCVLLILAAMALTVPLAESGVNDDWAYAKVALDLAQTGHLIYNGWSTAMLGAQAYWGALFIKLFGFSFLVVRLSTVVLAVGSTFLLYALHRRTDLPPGLAVLGTLTIVLSPVFILNAVSFMTDIPAFFLLLASTYGYVRVAGVLDNAEASTSWQNRFRGWLLFALVTGLLSGTVRQPGWIMPVFAPVLLLGRRRAFQRLPSIRLPLALSAVVAFGAALWLAAWFNNQPYVEQTSIAGGFRQLSNPQAPLYLCRLTIRILLTLGVFSLPLLVTLPALYRPGLRGQYSPAVRIRGALLLTTLLGLFTWRLLAYRRLFPWLDSGTLNFPYLLGIAPMPPGPVSPAFPLHLVKVFSVFVIILVSGGLALWVATTLWRPAQTANAATPVGKPIACILFGMFSIGYVLLLLLHGLIPDSLGVSDRYLLPLLPLATLGLLSAFHQWTRRERPPLLAWFLVALFACYGVAQGHDYFAQLRARLAITGYLEQRGIPRTRILAGLEYDGWTQITVAGHCNDSRILKPAGSYVPPKSIGFVTRYEWWKDFPAVQPDFVVALAAHPGLFDTDAPPVEYSCWLPRFHRRLLVQTSDPAQTAIKSLPVRPVP